MDLWLPAEVEHSVQLCDAILRIFRDEGARGDRQKARLMWLVEEYGVEKFREAVLAEMAKNGAKLATLAERIERARQKVEREKAEAKNKSLQTYVSIGSAVLGALLGRRTVSSTTIGKAATSMRSASRAARQQADVAHAEESLLTLEEKRLSLEDEIANELDRIRIETTPEGIDLEKIEVPARRTGTSVEEVVLAWVPS
jgi:sulfite reductase beta subunit-like hemoprotein